MSFTLIPPTALSAGEVCYGNRVSGLTGAPGYPLNGYEKTGVRRVVAQVQASDIGAGITGATKVAEFGFITNEAGYGSTGAYLATKDLQTNVGATGILSITADEALNGVIKTIEVQPSGMQGRLYGYAKGLTGVPCVSVQLA